jgi:hypothetical protein
MGTEAVDGFLLGCLAANPDPVRLSRSLPRSAGEWNLLVERGNRHGVTPLLYSRLKALGDAVEVPDEVRRSLKRIYLATANRNARMYHQLSGILGSLREAGVRVIVLKGAHLAELVYGNVALRAMSDVDLLVAEKDLPRAGACLLRQGLAASSSDERHANYLDTHLDLHVELHGRLSSPSFPIAVDLARVWSRSRPARIAGVDVEVLSPEDLVIHLCFHAAYQHQFEDGLRSLCDVSAVIAKSGDSLDWKDVCATAARGGLARTVRIVLSLAKDLLAAAIPARALELLGPGSLDTDGKDMARERILGGKSESHTVPISADLAHVWQTGGIGERVGVVAHCFLPSRQRLARLYSLDPGSWRVTLCYPRRVWDLLSRYRKTAWNLVRRDETTLKRMSTEYALRTWLEGH